MLSRTHVIRFPLAQARIMEQNLINQYGMQKNGGSLYNQRNSIAPKYWGKHGIKF